MSGPASSPQAARERYQEAQAEADRALEAAGGTIEPGTPEGDRAADLDREAEVAWQCYHEAWDRAYAEPEPAAVPDPEPEPEAGL